MLKDFTKEKFDVIILGGQSNAEGYGFGPVEEPYVPTPAVWYMHGDGTVTPATEFVNGNEIQSTFALSFAREYVNRGLLAEGRKLLILRTAVGGTGFLDNHWKIGDDLYERMIQMTRDALALQPENRLVALLWHQGESDACLAASFDVHYNHLMTLLQSVRNEFGVPDLPFIAGDFVHHWKNNNLTTAVPVADAIRAVCRECTKGAFVETDGLLSNLQELGRNPLGWEDTIHFSRVAVYELGKRYFAAYTEITGA